MVRNYLNGNQFCYKNKLNILNKNLVYNNLMMKYLMIHIISNNKELSTYHKIIIKIINQN
jgi:hypothetical protein